MSQPTGLLPAATFPPLAWFHRAQRSGVEVCVHEHYVKQSLRNRVALVGPEGPFDLSLPVHRRGASTRNIRDVLFTDRVEPKAFLRVLQTNCGRAPFFDHLLPEVEAWAHEHLVPGAPLLEASLASTRWACHWLGMAHPPVTQRYHEHVPHDHRHKSAWRGLATPTYPQVFEDRLGFVAGRSILDVLFHVGPEAALLPSRHGNVDPEADRPS